MDFMKIEDNESNKCPLISKHCIAGVDRDPLKEVSVEIQGISNIKDEKSKLECDGIPKIDDCAAEAIHETDYGKVTNIKIENEQIDGHAVFFYESDLKNINASDQTGEHEMIKSPLCNENRQQFRFDINDNESINPIQKNHESNHNFSDSIGFWKHDKLPYKNLFQCQFCIKMFNCKSRCDTHMRIHTGEKPFSCKFCAKKFSDKSSVYRHMSTHTGMKPFLCEICTKKFARKSYLRFHMRTHTIEAPFYSKYCTKRGENSRLDVHAEEKPLSCKFCGKVFSQKSSLYRHIRTHIGEKPFSCDICTKKFARKSHVRSHMRTHIFPPKYCTKQNQKSRLDARTGTHTAEKPFSCNFWENKFSQKSSLDIHMRTHTGEKPYFCEFCAKKFANKSYLYSHRRTHTGEKPYSCKLCAKKFTQKAGLHVHMRTHTAEKPFSCNFCTNRFSQKSGLKRHIRTHTGEKPFSCNFCFDNNFSLKSSLDKHIRSHHTEQCEENPLLGKTHFVSKDIKIKIEIEDNIDKSDLKNVDVTDRSLHALINFIGNYNYFT